MTGKRRVYWISDSVDGLLRERALLLHEKGYDVQFFTSLETLLTELAMRRAGILVVGDEGDPQLVEHVLLTLMSLPEIHGARLIFSTRGKNESLRRLASCGNFRDILPLELDDKAWVTRFVFATAGRPLPFTQPAAQITMNNISAVALPARINWIGPQQIRLECRVRPPIGASLNLTGALAEAIGVQSITLQVQDTERQNLMYRFSDAIVCDWSVPAAYKERAEKVLSGIAAQSPGTRCKVFLALQNPELRSDILNRFDDPRFEVTAALQKQAIVDEPRFFTPDFVVIEDVLVADEGGARFDKMMEQLGEQVPVLVLGTGVDHKDLKTRYPDRRIVVLARIPNNLTQNVIHRYLPQLAQRKEAGDHGAYYLTSENPYSLAEVSFPARLTRIHPLAAQVTAPFPIGNYALARIESPLLTKVLGRSPFLKVTATYQDLRPDAGNFGHGSEGYLADLDRDERSRLGEALARLVTEQLTGRPALELAPESAGSHRTPELGTARADAAVPNNVRRLPVKSAPPNPKSLVAEAKVVGGEPLAEPDRDPNRVNLVDLTELIKPALDPVTETVQDLKREVRRTAQNPTFQFYLKCVAIVAFCTAILWAVVAVLAPNWKRSGGVYTDQLRKFAPHHFEKDGKAP